MKKALGIDIGTTSICILAVDVENKKTIKSETVLNDSFIATKSSFERVEQAKLIIEITKNLLDSYIDEEVISVGLTGQMHGIVYFDQNGELVSNLYTWQDSRSNEIYKNDMNYADYLGTKVGYGNATDFYNRVNNIIPSKAVGYCTIADYLGMVLTGNLRPIMHSSNAASLGLYNYVNNCFNYNPAKEIQVSKKLMIIGKYKGVPVSVAIGDNQASVLGSLKNQSNLLLNIGTGGQVSLISDAVCTNKDIESRPFFANKYLLVGCSLCAGKSYSILMKFFKEILEEAGLKNVDVYNLMNKFLYQDSEPLIVDTRFDGTRNDNSLKGSIVGISSDKFTPSSLTKGFANGIVKELFDLFKLMNVSIDSVVCSGNAIRKNPYFKEQIQSSFNLPIYITTNTEEAAFGAALSSIIALDGKEDLSLIRDYIDYGD